MRRFLIPLVLALTLLAVPATATAHHTVTHDRCTALTRALNQIRTARDIRVAYTLCKVGMARAKAMAAGAPFRHDLGPVKRALARAGICWSNVGEVIAWTTPVRFPLGSYFMFLWRRSPSHWDVLKAGRYDRGGGSWARAANGRTYSVYYVLDTSSFGRFHCP